MTTSTYPKSLEHVIKLAYGPEITLEDFEKIANPEPKPKEFPEFVKPHIEIGERYANHGRPVHKKDNASKWTDAMKMAACPRNGGQAYAIVKSINGQAERIGYFCNMCPGCYKVHASELKDRMDGIDNKCKNTVENGHWRRKIVDDDKEAKALKKRISRNQGGRHAEHAADMPNYNEIWCYVEDDPESDLSVYGEVADPNDIDFDKVYENNRKAGKKFSVGKPFKRTSSPPKENTIRVTVPEIIVNGGGEAAKKAEKIARETNYLEKAKTAKDAIEIYAYQFKHVIAEIEKEGIEIAAVKHHYRNMAEKEILDSWNDNVDYWMSINAPLSHDSNGAKVDTYGRLYYPPNKKEPEQALFVDIE